MNELDLVLQFQSFVVSSSFGIAVAIFCARWLIFVYVPVGMIFFFSKNLERRHAIIEALWSAALALASTAMIAHVVDRARPFLADPYVSLLIPQPLNTSFPSGHTATAFAIAAALAYGDRRLGILFFVIATLVALGRVVVGVHYPTDLLGGAILGIACFATVRFLHRQIRTRDLNRAAKRHTHP